MDDDESEPEIQEIPPPPSSSQPLFNTRTPYTSPLRQSRLINTPSSSRRSRKANPLEVDVDASSDGSSDIGQIKFEPKGKGKGPPGGDESDESIGVQPSKRRRTVVDSDDEEDEHASATIASDASDIEDSTKKRKSRITRRTSNSGSGSDNPSPRKSRDADSSDEEDMSGIDEDQIVSSRLRKKTTKLTARQKLLEKLKSKRTGKHVDLDDSDDSEEEEDSNEEDSDVDADVIPGARPDRVTNNKRSISDSEEDEDDFIVDDADQSPTSVLPTEFSMEVHQDITHHFKIACQYLVHLAVTPAKKRSRISKELLSDTYFSVPLGVLQRKFSSIRDTISSSIWRKKYTNSLKKYPDFEVTIMDFAVPSCDACRIGSRMSKYIGRLSGEPYDPETFEPVGADDSDDSGSEDNVPVVEYHLGRYCARRTRIYHELTHWEQSVYSSLSREVEELSKSDDRRTFLQIGYSERIELPKDPTNADDILEWLDKRGIIDSEWDRIKKLIAQGSNIDVDARKEGPDE